MGWKGGWKGEWKRGDGRKGKKEGVEGQQKEGIEGGDRRRE